MTVIFPVPRRTQHMLPNVNTRVTTNLLFILPLAGLLLTSATVTAARKYKEKPTAVAKNVEWVINDSYRLVVTVNPGSVKRHQTPVGVAINFAELLKSESINGRLDRNSIRVVRIDPTTGQALPYREGSYSYPVPHQLSHDFFYQDSGKVWWRMRDEKDRHFHIYFDVMGGMGAKDEPHTVALVGVGDIFLFNNGQAGILDVSMSSAMRYVDWDGDSKKDLLVGSHQTHEYGVTYDSGMPGFIYFFKNIGTVQQPLFARGFQIKDQSGLYVMQATGGYASAFEVFDWNGDGLPDLIVKNPEVKALFMYENTGKRGRDNMPILQPAQEVFKIKTNPSQAIEEGGGAAANDYYRYGFRMLDWNSDGDEDILFSIFQHSAEPKCDSTKKVCRYEAMPKFFELLENKGRDISGQWIFATPRIIRVAVGSGAMLTMFGAEIADYVDWTGDGKPDLIAGDIANDPLGASRMLLFENIGTRAEPKFLTGRPIVSRVEGFDIDATPIVLDWDGDGDNDLLVSGYQGWGKVYTNRGLDEEGTPRLDSGTFVIQTEPKITGGKQTRTAVADWNGDGRLDLVQGGINGWVSLYENMGTNIDPVFKAEVRLQAAGQEIRFINGLRDNPQGPSEPNAGYTAPVVVDFDRDGDLDLIVGDMRGYQTYFENKGSSSHPVLATGRRIEVNGEARSFGWRNELGVGDIDGDGDVEIVSTAFADRHLSIYKLAAVQDDPRILKMIKAAPVKSESGEQVLPPHAGGNNNGDYMTKLADWDGDGDLDILLGTLYHVWYYENVGTKKAPVFKGNGKIMAEGKPLMVSGHAGSVDAVDWNGDGRLDLVLASESGWTHYFERSFVDGNLPHAEVKRIESRP